MVALIIAAQIRLAFNRSARLATTRPKQETVPRYSRLAVPNEGPHDPLFSFAFLSVRDYFERLYRPTSYVFCAVAVMRLGPSHFPPAAEGYLPYHETHEILEVTGVLNGR